MLFKNTSDVLTITQDPQEPSKLRHTLKLIHLHGHIHVPPEDYIKNIFRKFDEDRDNYLNRSEVHNMVFELYAHAVDSAEKSGAPTIYIRKAKMALNTEKGNDALNKASDELINLLGHHDKISSSDLYSILKEEAGVKLGKGKYWRMAPLCEIKIVLDDFVDDQRVLKLFVAGAMAGSCSRTAGSPLSRITLLQQTISTGSAYQGGILKITKEIIKKEGLRGLFRGNLADVMRAAPQSGISFLVYENAKQYLKSFDTFENFSDPKFTRNLLAGAISGIVGTMCTYPLDLVRTRLAVAGGRDKGMYDLFFFNKKIEFIFHTKFCT